MSETPTAKQIVEATGISPSYASMILSGDRSPPRGLAIAIFRKTDWKHHLIAEMDEADMQAFERHEPWTPPAERAA